MTRKRRRELARAVEDLDRDPAADEAAHPPMRAVYRDPVTGRCFEGRAPDAAPVETLPEDADLLVIRRALSMTLAEATAEGREILDVTDEHGGEEVAVVRVEPAADVDAAAAVTLDEEDVGPAIDFTGVDT